LDLAARSASEGNREALRAAAKGFATAEVPFDVYLDDEGRIRDLPREDVRGLGKTYGRRNPEVSAIFPAKMSAGSGRRTGAGTPKSSSRVVETTATLPRC
ncbi:hypothetical protein EAO69_11020, partial [Streptomyces sp. me109]